MIGIISLVLLGVGVVGCVMWSANTTIKWQKIVAEIIAFVGITALSISIAFIGELSGRDTADAAETEREQILEIVPSETGSNITITAESITPEQLIKMFIEKWNGELPDTITVYIPENINYETEKIQ